MSRQMASLPGLVAPVPVKTTTRTCLEAPWQKSEAPRRRSRTWMVVAAWCSRCSASFLRRCAALETVWRGCDAVLCIVQFTSFVVSFRPAFNATRKRLRGMVRACFCLETKIGQVISLIGSEVSNSHSGHGRLILSKQRMQLAQQPGFNSMGRACT